MIAEPTTVAEAARVYAGLGLSVIPCVTPIDGACSCGPQCTRGPGKHPDFQLMPEWGAYSKRQPAPAELDLWWPMTSHGAAGDTDGGGAVPTYQRNIAVVTGQVSGGLVVLDCDDPDTYAALCYRYRELRQSLTVRTGNGFHVYAFALEPVRTHTFTANGHTHHIKAEGGYVVAPPSLHVSGRRYAFIDPPAVPLVLDLDRLKAALSSVGATKANPQGVTTHEQGWVARLLREGAGPGQRDDASIRLAGYFTNKLPLDICEAILQIWAEERCAQVPGDPWGLPQVQAKLRSASRYRTT